MLYIFFFISKVNVSKVISLSNNTIAPELASTNLKTVLNMAVNRERCILTEGTVADQFSPVHEVIGSGQPALGTLIQ